MRKAIGLLSILLAAQLLLAVGMSFTGPDLAAVRPDRPLIELGERSADRLTIQGTEDQRLVLVRKGEAWVLPEVGDYPADSSKVDGLLERLKGLKRGLAVATTEGAQKRFKVSDESFERRVSLFRGDDSLATLYFGTSPGVRRVHVRSSDDAAVYTAEFGLYDLPVKPGDWEDNTVLQLPLGEIENISVGEIKLNRAPDATAGAAVPAGDKQQPARWTWSAAGLVEGETINQANADALAQKLAELRIGSVLGREAQPGYGLDTAELMLTVQRKDGEAIEYRLGKREQQNDYVLKVSSRPEYFRLPAYTADALIKAAGRGQLVAKTSEAAGTDETGQGSEDPAPQEGVPEPQGSVSVEDASSPKR